LNNAPFTVRTRGPGKGARIPLQEALQDIAQYIVGRFVIAGEGIELFRAAQQVLYQPIARH
jgi:hypothetical protein